MIRLIPFLLLVGCVQAPIAPNLKLPELAQECPRANLPPVPLKMKLIIDGDMVSADAEGERLLRSYVFARQRLRGVPSTALPPEP
jgi:hypothetical protein